MSIIDILKTLLNDYLNDDFKMATMSFEFAIEIFYLCK